MSVEHTIAMSLSDILNSILEWLTLKTRTKRNKRLSIMNVMFSLSSIPIDALKRNYRNMGITEFYSNISFIYGEIETCTQKYISDNICCIKNSRDIWIREFWMLQKRFNDFILLYENGTYMPEDVENLVFHIIEMYDLLTQTFNEKYKKIFK